MPAREPEADREIVVSRVIDGPRSREFGSMSQYREHYATTADGITIGGSVSGQGPPLVFLQGIIGDGDLDWQVLAGQLTKRFTCHLPSMRGRGLSGDHVDLSIGRLAEDVLDYVASIGSPCGLVGWSAGAGLALVAAGSRSPGIAAVAAVELGMPRLMDEQERAAFGDALARMRELAAEGSLTDAVGALAGFVFNEAEIAKAQDSGYLEATARYVPAMIKFFEQQSQYLGPTPDDPDVLRGVGVPLLVLRGSDTKPYAAATARHVADHVPNARVIDVLGAGHAAPLTHPEALAAALVEFFEGAAGNPGSP